MTGRPRRCGWFDVPLMRYAAMINGFDSLVVTKLDVLDEMEKIPVCVAYRSGGQDVADMPATVKGMAALEPVYECLPGWQSSTFGISSYGELPARARDVPGFSGEEERRGSGLHLDGTRAQPDYGEARIEVCALVWSGITCRSAFHV